MSLRRTIEDATGLALTDADVGRALRELFPHDAAARAAHAPAPGTPAFDALLDLLVVPESWMFRDPAVFEEALRFVRARLADRPDARLRILSLPCAGGEEPYSVAMSLMRAGVDPRQCAIDAFDLSHAAIARARSGRYTRNAFRGADLAFRERHFTHADGHWTVNADVRAYVRFAQANLLELDAAALAGRYDLVFCRNLLIYFDEAATRRAAAVLAALLADDGLLLSGYAEAPALCRNGFTTQGARQVFALRKETDATAEPVPAARPRARAYRPSAARAGRATGAPGARAGDAAGTAGPGAPPCRCRPSCGSGSAVPRVARAPARAGRRLVPARRHRRSRGPHPRRRTLLAALHLPRPAALRSLVQPGAAARAAGR